MARLPSPRSDLQFQVVRRSPELVSPAKPTPHEFKLLSDVDDQGGLRFHIHQINFYRGSPTTEERGERDPVAVIRDAVARALVDYYPLAGRLREAPGVGNNRLAVECNGEGILFIEADADVRLEQLGEPLLPPFPCFDQLLFDVPGSSQVLHCPLLLIQVTRLKCGGFAFGLRLNHCMCDGLGIVQFTNAVAEIARGASSPSVQPVWERNLLYARDPPYTTHEHNEFDNLDDSKDVVFPLEEMTTASFFFSAADLSAIKQHLLRKATTISRCSTFEVLAACVWRSAIRALDLDPDIQVREVFPFNVRNKVRPPIPEGYYGNAFTLVMAMTTAGQLCENSLEYAVELIQSAKANITEEYMRSLIDLLAMRGKPSHTSVGASYLSVGVGADEVDLGWGKPVYGARGKVWGGAKPRVASLFVPLKDYGGESGTAVVIYLPNWAVERFADEVARTVECRGLFVG